MTSIEEKFSKLATDEAPGQEVRSRSAEGAPWMRGDALPGNPVDFSHGNVDPTAFEPAPGSLDLFVDGGQVRGQAGQLRCARR